MYEFTYTSPFATKFVRSSLWMGAVHAIEIPFVFGTPLHEPDGVVSDEDKDVARKVMTLWTNFARTGCVLSHIILFFKTRA